MTMDLFAKLDPNEENEKFFASEAADFLFEHLEKPVKVGDFKWTAFRLARELVDLAKQCFQIDEDSPERMLVLEFGIIVVVHLDRPSTGPRGVARELGKRLAALARRRFFPVKQGKKKDT